MPTIKDVTIPARLVAEYEDAERCFTHARDQSKRFYTEYIDTVGRYHEIKDADEAGAFWRRECEPRDNQREEAESASNAARIRLRHAENAILNVVAHVCGLPAPYYPTPKKEP